MSKIILLIGRSGSGKSTVAQILAKKYGMKELKSYTTRKPRYENEDGHIFVSNEEFERIEDTERIVAYTKYNGNWYCATEGLVDDSDIYVIDINGALVFKDTYKGEKSPFIVYLDISEEKAYERMLKRGDSPEKATERIALDNKEFDFARLKKCDIKTIRIKTDFLGPEEIAEIIKEEYDGKNN